MLVLGRLEAATFAAEGAAREAARTYVVADGPTRAPRVRPPRRDRAAGPGLRRRPRDGADSHLLVDPCLAPGSDVAARIEVRVPLPFVPSFVRDVVPLEVPVSAERVAPVDTYRTHR